MDNLTSQSLCQYPHQLVNPPPAPLLLLLEFLFYCVPHYPLAPSGEAPTVHKVVVIQVEGVPPCKLRTDVLVNSVLTTEYPTKIAIVYGRRPPCRPLFLFIGVGCFLILLSLFLPIIRQTEHTHGEYFKSCQALALLCISTTNFHSIV